MEQIKRTHPTRNTLLAVGLVCLFTLIAVAADGEFAGKWKGETKPQAAASPGGPVAGAPTPGGTGRGGAGRGGGVRGGGGGFGGGPQKVTLNLKQSKDNKVSGNITFGDGGQAEDVKDGRVSGNSITFKSGRAPQIYEYIGELKGEELYLTRVGSDGKTRPLEMVLKK
jgi:hypothetical protein